MATPERINPRVGLVVAMAAEAPPLFSDHGASAVAPYQVDGATIGLLISGVGPRRARIAAQRLYREFQPHYLLSLGVCGGVAEGLAVGDLVVADEVVYGQGHISLAGPRTSEAASIARRIGCMVHLGGVQTFDRPLLSRHGLSSTVLGADMECYAVAEVAQEYGLAVLVVKAISDIVPQATTPRTLVAGLWHFGTGFAIARQALARFADLYFPTLSTR
jgi:nucleoside phosphorylase